MLQSLLHRARNFPDALFDERRRLADISDGLTAIVDTSNVSVDFDPGTGRITVTPTTHFRGAAYFDYQITDSAGRSAAARVDLDVAFVNYPPSIGDLPALTGTEGQPFSFTLPANTVTDIENDPLLIDLQSAGGNALPSWLRFDRQTLTISGTPPASFHGDVALELSADDGQARVVKPFTLTIAQVDNIAPTVTITSAAEASNTAAQTITGTVTSGGTATVVGQTVTLTWMDASGASHSANVTLGQATFPD